MLPEERIVIVLVFDGLEIDSTVIVPLTEGEPERRAKTISVAPPRLIEETRAREGSARTSFEADPGLYEEPAKRTT